MSQKPASHRAFAEGKLFVDNRLVIPRKKHPHSRGGPPRPHLIFKKGLPYTLVL